MSAERQLSLQEFVHVEEGKSFRPFEGIGEFLPVVASFEDTSHLLAVPFEFEGVRGAFVTYNCSSDSFRDFLTPLGQVRIVEALEDGKSKLEEMPLGLLHRFYVTNQDQVDELESFKSLVKLGDKTYEMELVEVGERQEAMFGIQHDGEGIITGDRIYDGGKAVDVLLPMNLEKLSQIEITFVRK